MTPVRRRLLSAGIVATIGLVVALGVRPVSTDRIVSAYAIALAAIGMLALTRLTREASEPSPPSMFEHALSPVSQGRARPPELVRIEREITLGAASASHLHKRLAPLLREAAAARINLKNGRELLGDDVWEVVRPDRPEPTDRSAYGLPLRKIAQVVEALERL